MWDKMNRKPLLELKGVDASYNGLPVLRNVSFKVYEGEVCGLLGRNGMGKTTTLRTIMGIIEPKNGEVIFGGENITKKPVWNRVKLKIGYVPQEKGNFTNMSVHENLQVSKFGELTDEDLELVFGIFPRLKGKEGQLAGTLSGGEYQMLMVANALINNPSLLLIDEPTEGLQPSLVSEMESTLLKIKEMGASILLVEQNIPFCEKICDRIYFMVAGEIKEELDEGLEGHSELVNKYVGI